MAWYSFRLWDLFGSAKLNRCLLPLLVSLSLSGYPFSAIVSVILGVDGGSLSAMILRGTVLLLSLFLICKNYYFSIQNSEKFRLSSPSVIFSLMFALFISLYVYRMFWDFFVVNTQTYIPMNMYLLIFFFAIVAPCLAVLSERCLDMERIYKAVLVLLVVSVLLNLAFGAKDYLLQQVVEVTRIKNEKLNPISFGHLCASLLIFCVFQKFYLGKPFGFLWKVVAVFSLAGMFLANSKGPILSFLLVVSYMLHVRFSGRFVTKVSVFMVFLVGVGGGAWVIKIYTGIDVLSRFKSAFSSTEVSSTSRVDSIALALTQFSDSPVWGDSIVVRPAMGYPHNIMVETLMALGLLGGVIFSVLVLYSLYCSNRLARHMPEYSWSGFIYIQYLIGAQTSGALWNSTVFWFFMCFVVITHKFFLGRDFFRYDQ